MIKQLEQIKRDRSRINGTIIPSITFGRTKHSAKRNASPSHDVYEIVALHISPHLGERIMLSSERTLLEELFPESAQAVLERTNVSWNQLDGRQIIRFPLNGYCKLNSIQVLTRLLNAGFTIEASTGGGVEGQQFSEYLFVRKNTTTI